MRQIETVLVTGGAGFIGSALVRHLIENTDVTVVNVDALTYAGNLESLGNAIDHPRHYLEQHDICDGRAIARILRDYRPHAVIHLAAESHVDRSIDGPGAFIKTNIVGTYTLLEAALEYYQALDTVGRQRFVFHHVSTDEVYGSLGPSGLFDEESPYKPNSPYSASKASSDHLVRAWHKTYGLPVVISNCSNNYGPYQFPEKLIPRVALNALAGKPLPVYGTGNNVRDWLYVEDHVRALWLVLREGKIGESYNIGGGNERRNIDVVRELCAILDEILPNSPFVPHANLIAFVDDRPGHDLRYAICADKIREMLGWRPLETFESGLRKTVAWYLENEAWWRKVMDGRYQGERLGLRGVAEAGGIGVQAQSESTP